MKLTTASRPRCAVFQVVDKSNHPGKGANGLMRGGRSLLLVFFLRTAVPIERCPFHACRSCTEPPRSQACAQCVPPSPGSLSNEQPFPTSIWSPGLVLKACSMARCEPSHPKRFGRHLYRFLQYANVGLDLDHHALQVAALLKSETIMLVVFRDCFQAKDRGDYTTTRLLIGSMSPPMLCLSISEF